MALELSLFCVIENRSSVGSFNVSVCYLTFEFYYSTFIISNDFFSSDLMNQDINAEIVFIKFIIIKYYYSLIILFRAF
jgi:hypothetical protein